MLSTGPRGHSALGASQFVRRKHSARSKPAITNIIANRAGRVNGSTRALLNFVAHNPLVPGSNPGGPTIYFRSRPDTWVTSAHGNQR